jgi:hypothetical protein
MRTCHEYTCAACGGTFHSDASDADALMEYQEVFSEEMRAEPGLPVKVCDDCYQKMITERPPDLAWEEYKYRAAHPEKFKS